MKSIHLSIFYTALAMFATGFAAEPERLAILDFSNQEHVKKYQVPNYIQCKAVELPNGKTGLQLDIGPHSRHKQQYPYVLLPIATFDHSYDLSNYSRIEADVEKVSPGIATFWIMISSALNTSNGANLDNFLDLVPSGNRIVISMPLAKLQAPINDPSKISLLAFMMPLTEQDESFIIHSVTAVKDKVEQSPAIFLSRELEATNSELQLLKNKIKHPIPDLEKEFSILQEQIQNGQKSGFKGTWLTLRRKLEHCQENIRRTFFDTLTDQIYCYRYPVDTPLSDTTIPRANSPIADELSIVMASNEYRDTTFLAAAKEAQQVRVELDVPSELRSYCQLFTTTYYYIQRYQYTIGDLIEPLTEKLEIPAGCSREIRLLVGGNPPPGNYRGNILISANGEKIRNIPVTIEVQPIELAESPDNNGYAFFGAGVPQELERHRAALGAMKRYGLNVVSIPSFYFNQTEFDQNGNIVNFKRSVLDNSIGGILKMWNALPGTKKLKFAISANIPPKMPEDAAIRERAFVNWIGRTIETVKSYGIAEDQFFFVLGDEGSIATLINFEIPHAELIKKHFPSVSIAQNSSVLFGTVQENQRYLAAFDIFTPNFDYYMSRKSLKEFMQSSGKLRSTYRCLNMGALHADYYQYYRLYCWQSFAEGIYSTGLWTFNAHEKDLWAKEQRTTNVGYAMVNRNQAGQTVNTRRYETYRNGINDLRYLLTLKSLAEKYPDKAVEIEAFLETTVKNVTEHPEDRDAAEQGRRAVAQKILEVMGK